MSAPDFAPLHAAMQRWVDAGLLPGVSIALASPHGVHVHCTGWADKERDIALREDHLFRVFSNTKLVASCAALLLLEEGRFALDDPVERYLPALARRRVLRAGATAIDDTEPARGPITIRQLLSHTSGLAYGLLDPGTPLFKAYQAQRILDPRLTLAAMVEALGPLPLAFEPGTGWEYSIATDVLARLVEVVGGQPFDRFLAERVFQPLGLRDTGFVVPAAAQARLAGLYVGADPLNPLAPGLRRCEDLLAPGTNLQPQPRLSGGGGLVSSLHDMLRLLRSLLPGANTLLRPETLALMATNQLPPGRWIRFPAVGELKGRGHGLASGIVVRPGPLDHPEAAGELYWGGLAGTQWWLSPRHGIAGALMTQRWMGFGDPFVADLKREAYSALLGDGR